MIDYGFCVCPICQRDITGDEFDFDELGEKAFDGEKLIFNCPECDAGLLIKPDISIALDVDYPECLNGGEHNYSVKQKCHNMTDGTTYYYFKCQCGDKKRNQDGSTYKEFIENDK